MTSTAVPTRWWDPVGAHVGPDEVELAMLRGGGDVAKDVGQVLLALHRVGAAACHAVARQPLADEADLVLTLGAARARAAVPAVDTVAKGLGAGADPWLKDVLDDAEHAALALYRRCLAQRVAHPTAAERVAKVFGVPNHLLGPYARLAANPAARPAELVDLADRTLFDWVAKAADQPVDAREEVSKAPRERDRTRSTESLQSLFDQADRDYHGKEPGERDTRGRFAEVGEQVDAPETGPAVGEPAPAAPDAREMRRRRAERQAAFDRAQRQDRADRTHRAARTSTTRTPTTRTPTARPLTRKPRRSLAERQRAAVEHTARARALNRRPLEQDEDPDDFDGTFGDVLAAQTPLRGAHTLDQQVSLLLPSKAYTELLSHMGEGDRRRRVFRIGRVERVAQGVHKSLDMDTEREHPEIAGARKDLADRIRSARGVTGTPEYHWLEELPGYTPRVAQMLQANSALAADALKESFLAEQAQQGEIPTWSSIAQEMGHVDVAPTTTLDEDGEQRYALVWYRPGSSPNADRGKINLTEITLPSGTVSGLSDNPGGASENITVDPNLPLGVRATGGSSAFDVEAGATRTEVLVTRVSEGEIADAIDRRAGSDWTEGPKRARWVPEAVVKDARERTRDYHGREPGERDPRGRFADLQTAFDEAQTRLAQEDAVLDAQAAARARRAARQAAFDRQSRTDRADRTARVRRAEPRTPTRTARPLSRTPSRELSREHTRQARRRSRALLSGRALTREPTDDPMPSPSQTLFVPGFDYSPVPVGDFNKLLAKAPYRDGAFELGPGQKQILMPHRSGGLDAISAGDEVAFDEEHENEAISSLRKAAKDPVLVLPTGSSEHAVDAVIRRMKDLLATDGVTYVQLETAIVELGDSSSMMVTFRHNAAPTSDVNVVRWNDVGNDPDAPLVIREGRRTPALDDYDLEHWVEGWFHTALNARGDVLWFANPNVQEWVVEPRDAD